MKTNEFESDEISPTPKNCGEQELIVRKMPNEELEKRFSRCGYSLHTNLGVAATCPGTFRVLTEGRADARIIWPARGQVSGLGKVLRAFYDSGDDQEDNINVEMLFFALNKELRDSGREPWHHWDFAVLVARLDDELTARADRRRAKIVSFEGGRPPTDKTRLVERIRDAIGCSLERAYRIANDGTAVPNQQRALARAFAADPARNTPSAWWPRERARTWGREAVNSFRSYLVGGADMFEDGELGRVFAAVRPLAIKGWIDHDPPGLEALLADLNAADPTIPMEQVAALWTAFKRWRKVQ